jgi:hypothetical protein
LHKAHQQGDRTSECCRHHDAECVLVI